jgi:glycosyltransferase involved in cell wall biosynthesis
MPSINAEMMRDSLHGTLSVVIPTYNCRPLLERHVAEMAAWLNLADEVIVVDSRSRDGTREYLAERLRHPALRFIDRDRGLYQSWNEGIAATKGDWVYVSTAGDTIEREHLLKLMKAGTEAKADVVISPCRFVDEAGQPLPGTTVGNPAILRGFGGRTFVVNPPDVRDYVALGAGIQGLLGSCASDIFRGDFLRARPFPSNYGTHGDIAWTLRHAHEMRLCVVPEIGSTFCRHEKERLEEPAELTEIFDRIYAAEIRSGGSFPGLALSLTLRSWRSRRKQYAREGAPFRGRLASIVGFFLKLLLAARQAPRKLRRLSSARALA